MNWLAHIFLSAPTLENRLGNLLGDLVKGGAIEQLESGLKYGIARHYAIDKFTDSHPLVKISKYRIDREYRRFSGILIDVIYDHFLAKNWEAYSQIEFADFISEIYTSFQTYSGNISRSARETIDRMIAGDWLTSYRELVGIEHTLARIDYRIRSRMGDCICLVNAMPILEREYLNLDRDFNLFFPELQQHISDWDRLQVRV